MANVSVHYASQCALDPNVCCYREAALWAGESSKQAALIAPTIGTLLT